MKTQCDKCKGKQFKCISKIWDSLYNLYIKRIMCCNKKCFHSWDDAD